MPVRSIEGRRIAWREAGTGAPALLLHCSLAHSGAFAGMGLRLSDVLSFRALDLPGHGDTGYDPARGLQEQAAADARVLLRDRPPAHLVGHSFGATVALRLAVESPELITSLTLIEPVQYSLLAEAAPALLRAENADEAAMHAAVAACDWRAAAEAFLSRWGGTGGLATMSPQQAAYAVARMPLIIAAEPDLFAGPGVRVHGEDLARIACPVLLVAGATSPPVIHAILDAVAARVPQARRLTVPGAGHMVPISHPEAVSRALRGFLALEDA